MTVLTLSHRLQGVAVLGLGVRNDQVIEVLVDLSLITDQRQLTFRRADSKRSEPA